MRDEGLSTFVDACPNLTELNLTDCTGITDKAVIQVLQKDSPQSGPAGSFQRHLHSLILKGCNQLTESVITQAAKYGGLLHIALWSSISDKTFSLLGRCEGLIHLDISDCTLISTKTLCKFIKAINTLQIVNLDRCTQLNDTVLIALAKFCKTMTSLSISSCKFTNDGLINIINNCPGMEDFVIDYCSNIGSLSFITMGINKLRIRTLSAKLKREKKFILFSLYSSQGWTSHAC